MRGPGMALFIIVFIVWTLAWKGYALWTATKADHKKWFIAMIIVNNTLGILEIIYIFYGAKKKLADVKADLRRALSSIRN